MRWLQNIYFASASFPSSSKIDDCDAAAGDLRKSNSCEDQRQRQRLFHRRDRRIGVGGPTLTRARKLRHLTDYDVAASTSLRPHTSDTSDLTVLSRSANCFSSTRCSSVEAVPLPLPLPEVKPNLVDVKVRLRSTKEAGPGRGVEERERDGVRGRGKERDRTGEGMLSNSPISR